MKKLISALLIFSLLLSLAGCKESLALKKLSNIPHQLRARHCQVQTRIMIFLPPQTAIFTEKRRIIQNCSI